MIQRLKSTKKEEEINCNKRKSRMNRDGVVYGPPEVRATSI